MAQPEVKETKVIDPKKVAKRAAKKAAILVLKEFADKSKDEKFISALKTIKPSLYGVQGERTTKENSPMGLFLKMVREAGKAGVHEDVIFKTLKSGRRECQVFVKKGLKRSAPEDRLWIKFDAAKATYTLIGTGTNPPANWEGYVPIESKIDLK